MIFGKDNVENNGREPLRFLELFNAPRFVDVSLTQWMALTPHELVAAHLNINRDLLEGCQRTNGRSCRRRSHQFGRFFGDGQ
jgi:hypothetical protein